MLWPQPDPLPGNFLSQRIVLPDVTLTDQHEAPRRLRDLALPKGLIVVNFSYTTCTSICPLGNVVMQVVEERRGEVARPVTLVSITIDPQRDTPSHMRKAAEEFGAGPDWAWLTGNPADIGAVLASAGARVDDIVLHDPIFLVGDPGSGQFYRSFSMPDPDQLLALLNRFPA